MNPNLREFWAIKSRYKVLYGGRGSSKSHDACGRLIYITKNYKLKILAVRQFQNKISDSVYTLLKNKIESFNYEDSFNIINNSIKSNIGSEFLFYGINRNITEIKSTEDVDILYIEEAHALTKEQWDILKPTIRKNNSEIWLVFNPDLVTDFVYKRFIINTPKNCIVRHINYNENPFATDTFLKEAKEALEENEDEYNHVYLGYPKIDDNEAIIKRSWIEASIDAHIKLGIEPTGTNRIGYDIADSGEDSCVTIKTKGILAFESKKWFAKEDELEDSAEKVYRDAKKDNSHITYDSIGVGASAGSTFKRLNKEMKMKMKYSKFNAGDSVLDPDSIYADNIKNKDMFSNLKAQAWWDMADRLKETYNAITKDKPFNPNNIISISSKISNLEELKEELSIPRKNEDKTGKVMVESKKDLKKRIGKSPDIADAFIMAYVKPEVNPLLAAMRD